MLFLRPSLPEILTGPTSDGSKRAAQLVQCLVSTLEAWLPCPARQKLEVVQPVTVVRGKGREHV